MSDRAALLSEAYRRGILPPDMRATYEEAQRRGLVGDAPAPEVEPGPTVDPGDSVEEARRRAEQLGWAQQAASRSPWGSPSPQSMAAVPRKGPSGAIEMDFPQPQPEPYFTAERGKSAASSVMRGFTGTLADVPKGAGIQFSQMAVEALADFDRIDRGEAPKSPIGGPTAQAQRYLRADPESRARMREETTRRSDPRNLGVYKAGEAFEKQGKEAFPTDPQIEQEFFAGKVPQGFGSMAAFLAGGVAGRALKAPRAVVPGVGGSLVGNQSIFADALKEGADLETALRAARMGPAVGATEAVPIERLLTRLDRMTGGSIAKALANGLRTGTEEFVQEVGQQIVQNLTARGYYDPERGVFKDTEEQGAVGFTVGGLMGFLAGLVGGRRGGSARSEAEPPRERAEPHFVAPEAEPAPAPAPEPAGPASTAPPETATPPTTEAAPAPPGERPTPSAGAEPTSAPPPFVVTPAGRRVAVTYEIVEADDLVTSHGDDLAANPAFPAELQPRDRSRAASAEQVASISQNLVPELLGPSASATDGAPIVGDGNVVESGNARTIALRRAYGQNLPGAQKYRDYLQSQGFDVAGFRRPVLVRRRTTPLDGPGRASFAREANERTTASMSAAEQAMADARAMPDWLLETYRGGDLGLAVNREFVRKFLESVTSPTDRGRIATATGELSQEGLTRIENAVFARAFEDARLLAALREDADSNVKAIGGAMMDAAPAWAQMRARAAQGAVPAALDITPQVREAAALVRRSRAEGKPLADLLRQHDAFDRISPEAEAILRLMFADAEFRRPASRQRVGDALRFYAAEATKAEPGSSLLGGLPEVRALDILKLARTRGQGGLFGGEPQSGPPPTAAGATGRPAWRADFPAVVINRAWNAPLRATDHPRFKAAKAGDMAAALDVVESLIDEASLRRLAELVGPRKPVLVAVSAAENSRNRLPLAYAHLLAHRFGWDVNDDVVQANRPDRRSVRDALLRFNRRAEFDGLVQADRDHLLVDDHTTLGGSLADLRAFIEARGGRVIAATTLTGSRFSEDLRLTPEVLAKLRAKHGGLEAWWRGRYGYGFEGLTNAEARHLLKFASAQTIRDRLAAEDREAGQPQAPGAAGQAKAQGRLEQGLRRGPPAAAGAFTDEAQAFERYRRTAWAQGSPADAAGAFVVRQGVRDGFEHLVALDGASGALVSAHTHGLSDAVVLTDPLKAALDDARRRIVVHHNHPAGVGLSAADLSILSYRGAAGVAAYDHFGNRHFARLSAGAAERLPAEPAARHAALFEIVAAADRASWNLLLASPAELDFVDAARAEATARALRDAGVMEYHSSAVDPAVVEHEVFRDVLAQVTEGVRRRLGGSDARRGQPGADGPAGDLDAPSGAAEEAAAGADGAARDRAGGTGDRGEAVAREPHGLKAPAGRNYVGPRQDAAPTGAREVRDPKRRDAILKALADDLGVPFYQGRIKRRSRMLGFFRPLNHEIRLKRFNDAETAAHEAAHLLDYRFPEIRQQWRPATGANAAIRAELAGVSYDRAKLYEGFAEFVRLWATQPQFAQAHAPAFSAWWEQHLDRSPHGPAVRRFKQDILAWFDQDALLRAASKIGPMENIGEATRGLSARLRQSVFDDLEGVMRMELALSGELLPVGPYETARLTRAKESIVEGALLYGAPKVNADGSHAFEGKGLRDILRPVAGDLDRFWLYAVGVSAGELKGQGRENLFTANEIAAMKALETPAFRQAFAEYQDWNRAIVNFALAKGALDPAQVRLWRRTMYLPFYRVGAAGGEAKSKGVEGDWKGVKALTGGTSNIRDVMSNVVKNAAMLIDAAITNEARMEIAKLAHRSTGGAAFLTRIPTEERRVLIPKDQIERTILDALGVGSFRQLPVDQQVFFDQIRTGLGGMVELFQRNQAPGGRNVFAALDKGKPVYFEVADPILFRSIMALNRPLTHPAIRALSWFRRLGQRSVTLTFDFMLKNLFRDSLMSTIMSRHGFRFGIESARGLASRIVADRDYRDFIANGGGLSSVYMQDGALKRRLERFYASKGVDWRTVLDTPAKLLDAVDRIADSFEVAARLGEFKRARAAGANARHAAYLGREVSTDFAMRGDDAFIGALYDSIVFLKAAANSWERLYRGLKQDPNRARIAILTGTLAIASVGLAALNYGNPLLDDTEDWDRDTSWHIFVPTAEWFAYTARTGRRYPDTVAEARDLFLHLRLPRIWEMGSLAAIAERSFERLMKGQPSELARDIARIVANNFHVEFVPQMVEPLYEVAINRNRFSDRPVVSKSVERLEPWAQSGPYGSAALRKIGEAARDVPGLNELYSPAKVEALLRGYFNTWAVYGLSLADWTLFEDTPDARPDQYWVLRSFYRDHPTGSVKELEELYDAIEAATVARSTARFMARTWRDDIAAEIMEKPEAQEARLMSRAARALQLIGAQLRGAMYVRDIAEAQAMAEARSAPGKNLAGGLKQRGKWDDLGAVKRVLIDDIVQERNAFARGLMRDVKARREQRKAAQPQRR